MLLPMKVYPQLKKHCPEEMKYGVMEQYLLGDSKIKLACGTKQFELSAFDKPENKKSQWSVLFIAFNRTNGLAVLQLISAWLSALNTL